MVEEVNVEQKKKLVDKVIESAKKTPTDDLVSHSVTMIAREAMEKYYGEDINKLHIPAIGSYRDIVAFYKLAEQAVIEDF